MTRGSGRIGVPQCLFFRHRVFASLYDTANRLETIAQPQRRAHTPHWGDSHARNCVHRLPCPNDKNGRFRRKGEIMIDYVQQDWFVCGEKALSGIKTLGFASQATTWSSLNFFNKLE